MLGTVTADDVRRTVRALPHLCAQSATVLWTCGRFASGDLTPSIRAWLGEEGFEEIAFHAPEGTSYRVGVHRLAARPRPVAPEDVQFTFVR